MGKTEQLNVLFSNWENNIKDYKGKFVRDGIIDEISFEKTSPKILFIAKEPNDPLQTSWDFREIWKTEFSHSFTYRIAEWACGIINDFKLTFDNLWDDPNNLRGVLQKISFMNIKKIGGKGSTDFNELLYHYKLSKEYIVKEIEIINPEIIILSLSFWKEITNDLFRDCHRIKSGYGIEMTKWKDTKIIDFYHPSAYNAPSASYCLLKNIYQSEILKTL
jgi:hypothetical protein